MCKYMWHTRPCLCLLIFCHGDITMSSLSCTLKSYMCSWVKLLFLELIVTCLLGHVARSNHSIFMVNVSIVVARDGQQSLLHDHSSLICRETLDKFISIVLLLAALPEFAYIDV